MLITFDRGLNWNDQFEGLSSFSSMRPYFMKGNQEEVMLSVTTQVGEIGIQETIERTIRYRIN